MEMKEFTFRAVLLGMLMTGILGAANAYLGLRAGMTIAATYPAAVIGMAVLRLMKGSILEENIARTVGAIGESVAAGAVFTIPAFVLAGLWPSLGMERYWESVALMVIGGLLGVLFVTLLRRVMVEDPELPFPESVAASEIHKAGQQGARSAKILFANMGGGALLYFLSQINLFWYTREITVNIPKMPAGLRLGRSATAPILSTGGMSTFTTPAVSPAYLGVGYIIGPRLAALNFAGGVLAWGLLVPLLIYFLGPNLPAMPAGASPAEYWSGIAFSVWFSIVRPIAVGGMLVGSGFTLFRMRRQLALGMKRAISDLKKSAEAHAATERFDRDLSIKAVFLGVGIVFLAMIGLYYYFISGAHNLSSNKVIAGAVVAALVMVALGVSGIGGVAAVLGVAAVVCVSSAVAGEMLQDLKAGHILGGTPSKMQIGDIFGTIVASLVLFFPLMILDKAYHFGSAALPAPQAGLMAMLAQGIVGGNMAWPLVVVGILMGFAMILVEVKSPMLFSVGMYLPLETTSAIFVGGIVRWITDKLRDRRGFNDAQKARVDNAGVLTASGLIAGEALCGLVIAAIVGSNHKLWHIGVGDIWFSGLIGLAVLIAIMVKVPLANAGRPEDPAPPTAIM
jgi:uncharacterized oligopeptide transporter (OPT) family protein